MDRESLVQFTGQGLNYPYKLKKNKLTCTSLLALFSGRDLDKTWYLDKYYFFFFFSMKSYIVGTH